MATRSERAKNAEGLSGAAKTITRPHMLVTIEWCVPIEDFNPQETLDRLRESGSAHIIAGQVVDGMVR